MTIPGHAIWQSGLPASYMGGVIRAYDRLSIVECPEFAPFRRDLRSTPATFYRPTARATRLAPVASTELTNATTTSQGHIRLIGLPISRSSLNCGPHHPTYGARTAVTEITNEQIKRWCAQLALCGCWDQTATPGYRGAVRTDGCPPRARVPAGGLEYFSR